MRPNYIGTLVVVILILLGIFLSKCRGEENQTEAVYPADLGKIQKMEGNSPFLAGSQIVIHVYASGGKEKGTKGRDPDLWGLRAQAAENACAAWNLKVVDIIYHLGADKAGLSSYFEEGKAERGVVLMAVPPDSTAKRLDGLEGEFKKHVADQVEINSAVALRFSNLEDSLANVEGKVRKNCWSFLAGWQGVAFDASRDLAVPTAGLQFSTGRFYVNLLGGINPWSTKGYRGYYFRDALGSANMGFIFWQPKQLKFSVTGGGIIGWEYTTSNNQYTLQVNGFTSGLGVEYQVKEKLSFVLNASYVRAETEDITPRSGIMRNGVVVNCGIKLF